MTSVILLVKVLLDTILQINHKTFQKRMPSGIMGFCVNTLTVAVSSLFLYGAVAGFDLSVNFRTFQYAFLFSVVVTLNFVFPFLTLRYMSVVSSVLFNRVGGLIITLLYGYIFLNEKLTVKSLIAILLMLSAVLLSVLKQGDRRNGDIKGYLYGIICALLAGLNTIISENYAIDPYAEGSSAAFCFYVNVFIIINWIIFLAVYLREPENTNHAFDTLKKFDRKLLIIIMMNAVISATNTLFNLFSLSRFDLSYYTVITNAGFLILVTFASKVFFFEKISKMTCVSIISAILSIVFTAL